MRIPVAVAVAVVACGGATHPISPATPGVTIAIYGSAYAIVDERRELHIDGDQLLLDHVELGADLASLWIEPLDASRVAIDHCARPSLPVPAGSGSDAIDYVMRAPVVQCRASGRGTHLVRVHYVTAALVPRVEHAIAFSGSDDRARIESRFAVTTPPWHERGTIVVLDHSPGDAAPRELVRREVTLDGSVAIVTPPPRDVAAHLRSIFTGALPSPAVEPGAASWHAESTHEVWVWLELELDARGALSPGMLHVRIESQGEPRDIDVAKAFPSDGARLRVPLWQDVELAGTRTRIAGSTPDGRLVEQFTQSVGNLGASPRTVWIEEQARPGAHRRLTGGKPAVPTIDGDVLRSEVQLAPRSVEAVRYTVEYEGPLTGD
ncbi:MAG TPA: hypothetical protein VH143_03895 [Kofleriaceae bacterium]|jgi:hypothetical protein|nr:hypothetical protein [Kofleriaceae bacterium]